MQFGPGAMQQHGFARNLDWTIASTSADPNPDEKDPSVELILTEVWADNRRRCANEGHEPSCMESRVTM